MPRRITTSTMSLGLTKRKGKTAHGKAKYMIINNILSNDNLNRAYKQVVKNKKAQRE